MEVILYNENKNIISLIEQNNTEWQEIDTTHEYKVENIYKYKPNYHYTLKVNSNIVWSDYTKEKLTANISDDILKIEEENSLLLPLIAINVDKLLNMTNKEQMNDYIKTYKELKEEKEFKIMQTAYRIGNSIQLETDWEYSIDYKTKELYKRLKDYNSKEAQQFLSNLGEPLITILIHKNKIVDCLDKLQVTIFELREKLKKHPEVISMLCIEYKVDINDLISFGEDSDMKIVQKM